MPETLGEHEVSNHVLSIKSLAETDLGIFECSFDRDHFSYQTSLDLRRLSLTKTSPTVDKYKVDVLVSGNKDDGFMRLLCDAGKNLTADHASGIIKVKILPNFRLYDRVRVVKKPRQHFADQCQD